MKEISLEMSTFATDLVITKTRTIMKIKNAIKTGKTKSTKLQNEKYRINNPKQQNEKYEGGAKNTRHLLFYIISRILSI